MNSNKLIQCSCVTHLRRCGVVKSLTSNCIGRGSHISEKVVLLLGHPDALVSDPKSLACDPSKCYCPFFRFPRMWPSIFSPFLTPVFVHTLSLIPYLSSTEPQRMHSKQVLLFFFFLKFHDSIEIWVLISPTFQASILTPLSLSQVKQESFLVCSLAIFFFLVSSLEPSVQPTPRTGASATTPSGLIKEFFPNDMVLSWTEILVNTKLFGSPEWYDDET